MNHEILDSTIKALSDTQKGIEEVVTFEYIQILELKHYLESCLAMIDFVKQALKLKDRKLLSLQKPLEVSLEFLVGYLQGAVQARNSLYEIAGEKELAQYIKADSHLEEKIVVFIKALPLYLASVEIVKKSEGHIKALVKQSETFAKKKDGIVKDSEEAVPIRRSEAVTEKSLPDGMGDGYSEKELKFFINDLMNYLQVLKMQCEETGLHKYTNVLDEMKKFEKASRKMKLIGYYGERVKDLKEGTGQYYYLNGDMYDGEWKNDKKHGEGKYKFYNKGDRYEGQWREDRIDGKGTYYYANGDKYDGLWKEDKREGFGVFYYANGDKYDGEWSKDQMQGRGMMYYANGSKFSGDWKNNLINGRGTFIFANGYQVEEDWRDGVKRKEHIKPNN